MEIPKNLILPNGKLLGEGEGIDIVATIIGLRSIKRFPAHDIPDKFSVAEHLLLCGLLVDFYCDYMAEKFVEYKDTYNHYQLRSMLKSAVLTHDLEEVAINDIPTQFDEMIPFKEPIRKMFRKSLHMDVPETNVVSKGVKHLDKVAALIESVIAWKNSSSRNKIPKLMVQYYEKAVSDFDILDFVMSDKYLGINLPKYEREDK